MKNISKAKVLQLLMPSHSLEEQQFIAAELDEPQALTAEARISHERSTEELSAVFPSVLNQIFNTGEATT